ncbi:MAG: methyl-accepting chemotaxis protein, partial [Pseudomonadota bacterium]
VRTLAQRAADAARSISELVAESTVHVSEGVTQVEATGSLLVEIQAGIEQVVNSISEISAATREQASGIGEISQTLSNLDGETQTNAALVTRTIANAHHLGDLAASLGAGTAKPSPSEPALDTTAKPTEDSVEDPWAEASQTPEEDQDQKDEELQTYVPRPSHNLPNRGPLTATALSVADEDGWEEF